MINTRRIVRRLVEAGLDTRKAEALASVLGDAFAQPKGSHLPVLVEDLTRALHKFKVHVIAWQIVVYVVLFIALKATHAV